MYGSCSEYYKRYLLHTSSGLDKSQYRWFYKGAFGASSCVVFFVLDKGCFVFPAEDSFAFEAQLLTLFLQFKKQYNSTRTSSGLNVIILMLYMLFTTRYSLFHGRFKTIG